MVCSRSGSLALENAGDRSLVVREERRVQSPMTISCRREGGKDGLFLKIGQGPGAAVEGDIIWKSV